MPHAIEPCGRVDAEAGAYLGGHQPSVEALAKRRRQPIQLLEGAELRTGDSRVRQPCAPSSSVAGATTPPARLQSAAGPRARAHAQDHPGCSDS